MIADECRGIVDRHRRWHELADRVLDGHRLTEDEALAVLAAPDDELLDLLAAAFRVRRRYFGRTVQLYFLMNAKSGLCPEDCSYCSQSKVSDGRDSALQPAQPRAAAGRRRGGGRARGQDLLHRHLGPRAERARDARRSRRSCRRSSSSTASNICACLGLLTPDQAERLAACGVNKVNHNLNTSGEHYGEICTTHTYQDRVDTLRAVRDAGHGAVLRRHHRHGRAAARRRVDGDRAARPGRRVDPRELPQPHRRHAAGRAVGADAQLLPEGAGDVPPGESRRASCASPAAASCTSAACSRWACTRPTRSSSATTSPPRASCPRPTTR